MMSLVVVTENLVEIRLNKKAYVLAHVKSRMAYLQ